MAPLAAMAVLSSIGSASAASYSPGANDDEILIGMTVPLSGPASAYGIACAASQAFFTKVNQDGGINQPAAN
ncbi:hypothetical protein ACFQ4K_31790 [Tistrella bauzanensis]